MRSSLGSAEFGAFLTSFDLKTQFFFFAAGLDDRRIDPKSRFYRKI